MEARVINHFSELGADEHAYIYCLVLDVKTRTGSNGKPYVDVKISDGEGSVTAKVWNTDADGLGISEGMVIYSRISANPYMNRMTYVLSRLSARPDMDPKMFLSTAPIDIDATFEKMMERASKMRSPLRELVRGLLGDYEEEFKHAAAGRSLHHAFIGGLLYHSWRMCAMAERHVAVYPNLDGDMVVAGCMLHDIGKLVELDTDWKGNVEYTVAGSLFGHLFWGAKMVLDRAASLGVADSEDVLLLAHILASHHGEQALGAIKAPLTREAVLVHQLDMVDMEQEIMDENMTGSFAKPGEMSPKFAFYDFGAYMPHGDGRRLDGAHAFGAGAGRAEFSGNGIAGEGDRLFG